MENPHHVINKCIGKRIKASESEGGRLLIHFTDGTWIELWVSDNNRISAELFEESEE